MSRFCTPSQRPRLPLLLCGLAAALPLSTLPALAAPEPAWEALLPALQSTCFDCHGGKKTKGGVDLKRLEKDPSVLAEYSLWTKVVDAIKSGEMPPEDSKPLAEADRKSLVAWAEAALEKAALSNAGDPGPVTLRRLTNAEYDNALRDLTGIAFPFGRDFVPDGGGGEGFSNIGDALFISPQQLDKYFAAARKLADRSLILPGTGIRFREHHLGVRGPAQFKSDTEQEMVVWYQKMAEPHLPKDGEDLRIAEYLLACWKWKHREATGALSLESLAKEAKLSLPFLENWWNFLQKDDPKSRFLDLTRIPWRELPAPDPAAPQTPPSPVLDRLAVLDKELNSWFRSVLRAQQDSDELKPQSPETLVAGQSHVHLVVGDLGDGSQGDLVLVDSFELHRKAKKENYFEWLTARRDADRAQLGALPPSPAEAPQRVTLQKQIDEAEHLLALLGKHPAGRPIEPGALALQAPTVLSLPLPPDATRFRARGKLDVASPELEFASAQWTVSVANPPPDPTRIIPGVITLWKRGTETQKRVAGDFSGLHNLFSLNLEHRLNQVAQNRYRGGKPGPSIYYFSDDQLLSLLTPEQRRHLPAMREDWRFVASRTIPKPLEPEWDAKVRAHLESFAAKAWRRPLVPEEKAQLAAIYQQGIAQELDRESAAREVLVRILVAPSFLFKLEDGSRPEVHPVSANELASRLSFFLWSSIPDDTLRQKAADGSLLQPAVLQAETLRMLRDPKAEGLARQFAAQWFEFQSFETVSKVDTAKFPEFTPELRKELFEEAMAFLSHIIRQNRPVHEILTADYTFLNERLAKHYGIPSITGPELRQTKVSDHSRGGILAMGALLTKNSYPHRTSPVLRGNWLLHTVLGTPTPPPPNDVPKLDESVASAKSLRERLQRHRADRACASCHDKIDPLGFALESFDPIGRRRKTDEAGLPIDDSAQDKEGHAFAGVAGLRQYLQKRTPEFYALFSKKLLGYALGRSVLPTDKLLLEGMKKRLQSEDPSFAGAVLSVVQSSQFLNRRGD